MPHAAHRQLHIVVVPDRALFEVCVLPACTHAHADPLRVRSVVRWRRRCPRRSASSPMGDAVPRSMPAACVTQSTCARRCRGRRCCCTTRCCTTSWPACD
jgi:hypothetical protein